MVPHAFASIDPRRGLRLASFHPLDPLTSSASPPSLHAHTPYSDGWLSPRRLDPVFPTYSSPSVHLHALISIHPLASRSQSIPLTPADSPRFIDSSRLTSTHLLTSPSSPPYVHLDLAIDSGLFASTDSPPATQPTRRIRLRHSLRSIDPAPAIDSGLFTAIMPAPHSRPPSLIDLHPFTSILFSRLIHLVIHLHSFMDIDRFTSCISLTSTDSPRSIDPHVFTSKSSSPCLRLESSIFQSMTSVLSIHSPHSPPPIHLELSTSIPYPDPSIHGRHRFTSIPSSHACH